MARPKSAVVVVSHYNAWPTDQLIHLLDQMRSIPAGHPFSVRVVVNQAHAKPLELPDRHAEVDVCYRENVGYNIGAWEHGWRVGTPVDHYLFLQEECIIARPNWLRGFLKVVNQHKVGLVGESIAYYNTSWDDIIEGAAHHGIDPGIEGFRSDMSKMGVDHTEMADHLQSLILCARRDVLEAIGGFRIGITKEEARACEIAISKCVQSVGLRIRQVSLRPFEYIQHPQWTEERAITHQPRWAVRRLASLYLLAGFQRRKRKLARLRKGRLTLEPTH